MLQGNQLCSIPLELFQLKVSCACVFLDAICTPPACSSSAQTEARWLWVCLLLCAFITNHAKITQKSTVV